MVQFGRKVVDAIPGPIVDNAAAYISIGYDEFCELQQILMPEWNREFFPLPNLVKAGPFFKKWAFSIDLLNSVSYLM